MYILYGTASLEVFSLHESLPNDMPDNASLAEIPDQYASEIVGRIGFMDVDGVLMVTPGTILTQPQLDKLVALQADKELRADKVQDEILALIGMNVLDLTDAQRWKLVAAVFYKLGVISAAGVIQPYADWSDAA